MKVFMAVEEIAKDVVEAEGAVAKTEENELGRGFASGYEGFGGKGGEDADRECGLLERRVGVLHSERMKSERGLGNGGSLMQL